MTIVLAEPGNPTSSAQHGRSPNRAILGEWRRATPTPRSRSH